MMTPYEEQETMRADLFFNAVRSKWEEVIKMYKENQECQSAKITALGETALHIAIAKGDESTVDRLLEIVKNDTLSIPNEAGNTPLHLAASLGSLRMCRGIVTRDSDLIGMRNHDNETPVFLAVQNGKKDAYLFLTSVSENHQGRYGYCRRRNGDTILHSAIDGEHSEIAYHIIHHYKELQHSVNHEGLSPLHVLATKRSAFGSGYRISGIYKLIDHWTPVKKLNHHTVAEAIHQDDAKYPEHNNGGTFLLLLRKIMGALGHRRQQGHVENPNAGQLVDERAHEGHGFFHFLIKWISFVLVRAIILITIRANYTSIREKKKKRVWSFQIMKKLVEYSSSYRYEANGEAPVYAINHHFWFPRYELHQAVPDHADSEENKKETAVLIAAKNGIIEIVKEILGVTPHAIYDANIDKKNIVLLAVENRQPHICRFLLEFSTEIKKTIFGGRDKDGNNALHVASKLRPHRLPLHLPGPVFKMQWEVKWYEFVKKSMPRDFFKQRNSRGLTPRDTFIDEHGKLVDEASEWLKQTSASWSVVASLIATVAFTASTAIPGGLKQDNGVPALGKELAFNIFGIASLVALCFSVVSIVMFLSFFSSSYREADFNKVLPRKLLAGLETLFLSLAAMLVSFCAGHFLIMRDQLKHAAFPLYLAIIILVTFYAVAQFPWYFEVARTTRRNVPPRTKRWHIS